MAKIERVQVTRFLRGSKLYPEGQIFDVKDGPIPSELLIEVRNESGAVRVLPPLMAPLSDPEVPEPEVPEETSSEVTQIDDPLTPKHDKRFKSNK